MIDLRTDKKTFDLLYKSRYLSGAHAMQSELQAELILQGPTVPRPRQSSLRFGRHFHGLS